MKDYNEFVGREIRIRRYGYGKLVKINRDTFTFKIPVDDLKWEKLELDEKYLTGLKVVKDSELDDKRFRISFIVKNFFAKLLSWTGRSTRKEYLFGRIIPKLMLVIPSSVLGHFIMTRRPERLFVYLACILIIYGVIYFAGTISLTARRIQDAGFKGIYALIFYTVILTLLSYGWRALEEPLIFAGVMLAIYLIFELSLCCMVSDFDNKYGPCPIANLDDDEHVDGKKIKKIEGQYSNMKEFTDKIKNDNIEKENAKIKNAKVLEEEKKLLDLEKKEKEKKKEARSKSESEGESLKDLSERIRREAEGELIKNPERLRQVPKKKELTENEKLASYKIETDKLLKEFERLYDNGEITREEYKRLKEEVTKK